MHTSQVLVHWRENNAVCCEWQSTGYFLCREMLHPLEENELICKYLCTCVYCTKVEDTARLLALQELSCGAVWFFLQCHTACHSESPTTVPARTCKTSDFSLFLVFTSQHCQLYTKRTPGLELSNNSAYNSERAQGNLYATWPAHPPSSSRAKNSQWSCSGRNPTLSLDAVSQEKGEESRRCLQEVKPQSSKLPSQRSSV